MERPKLAEDQERHMRGWIDALRGGRYQQTNDKLRRRDSLGKVLGHCCLGVAVEEAINAGCPIHWVGDSIHPGANPPPPFGRPLTESSGTVLISPLVQWYGFNTTFAAIELECRKLGERPHGRNVCPLRDYHEHDVATCQQMIKVDATKLNDDYRWDFKQIADAFEGYYFGGRDAAA
jgi:hypothetical protein